MNNEKTQNGQCEDMGFRMAYKSLIQSKRLRTVFRPYDKKYFELYRKDQCASERIIAIPGNARYNIGPVYDDYVARVTVTDIRSVKIGNLNKDDFENSSPDVQDKESLKWNLALIYNRPVEDFSEDTKVVVIKLRYEE